MGRSVLPIVPFLLARHVVEHSSRNIECDVPVLSAWQVFYDEWGIFD
jgi:hypothetical protein